MISNLELYANCAKMFGTQSVLVDSMVKSTNELLNSHFRYQTQLISHSVKPYIPKIIQATDKYTEALYSFQRKREQLKNNLTDPGLRTMQNQLLELQQKIKCY